MAHKLNPYMNYTGMTGDNSNEQKLIHGFVTETIQNNGTIIEYIPRTLVKEDQLYGEDVLSAFSSKMSIEGMIESYDSFEGDSEIITAFDISVKDTVKIRFSRTRFEEEALVFGIPTRPMEGDLLYMPLAKALFEIKFTENENQFYPNGTLPSYFLTAEKFDYSMESFTTGDSDIDSLSALIPGDTMSADFGDNVVLEEKATEIASFNSANPFGEY